jgi:hypothetical protein
MVFVIHENVGNLLILQKWLEWAESKDLIEQVSLNFLLLVEAQRDPAVADDLADDARNRLTRLVGIDTRELLEIEL